MRLLKWYTPSGTLLNISDNINYKILKIEGLDAPDLNIFTEKAPYQDGTSYIDNQYQPRMVTVEGFIKATDKPTIATKRREMIAAFNPKNGQGRLVLEYEGSTYEIDAIASKPLLPDNFTDGIHQRFMLTFECPSPFWQGEWIGEGILLGSDLPLDSEYAIGENITILSYEMGGITFPLSVPSEGLAFSSSNSIKEIDNFGDINSPMLCYFFGPAVKPKVINNTTGAFVEVNRTLTEGQILIINSNPNAPAVTLVDVDGTETSAYNYITADSRIDLFKLQSGINEMQYTSEDNNPNAQVHIIAKSLYIGV